MEFIWELLKAVLFGIVEGITEWLPVSSTGHMILLDELVQLQVSKEFYEMFQVVIQLGAILAVILVFWRKLYPFSKRSTKEEKGKIWQLWAKVIVAVLPSAIIGLALDDWMDAHLYRYEVVAVTLLIYGVAFIIMERLNKKRTLKEMSVYDIDYKTAILIGCFQCLSLIPGTSRSGATILGAIVLGVGRSAGAEFSFYLAIPTMLGASALKLLKYAKDCLEIGAGPSTQEIGLLAVGCVVAFAVSMVVIKGLMNFVRKHDFAVFGIYRIVLAALVALYFLMTM